MQWLLLLKAKSIPIGKVRMVRKLERLNYVVSFVDNLFILLRFRRILIFFYHTSNFKVFTVRNSKF